MVGLGRAARAPGGSMPGRQLLSRLALPLLIVALACPSALAGGPAATGAGMLDQGGELRTFSFTARVMPDGSVKGMGNIHNRSQDNHVKFDIDCLDVAGNVATMSGRVTLTTVPEWADADVWFRAIDHGEGKGDPTDEMTLVGIFVAGGPPCGVDDAFVLGTLFELEGGNVQVRGGS